jgi:hypothetical protein
VSDQISDQGSPKARGRKKVSWRQDPVILARLQRVERAHFAGTTNVAIAAAEGVDEATIRTDLKRLAALWIERLGDDVAANRAAILAQQADIAARALAAAQFDEQAERAVLYGELPPDVVIKGGSLVYDEHGRIQFRGNKAAALGVARQAIMDAAKVQGLVIDKVAPVTPEGNALQPITVIEVQPLARRHDEPREGGEEPHGSTSIG